MLGLDASPACPMWSTSAHIVRGGPCSNVDQRRVSADVFTFSYAESAATLHRLQSLDKHATLAMNRQHATSRNFVTPLRFAWCSQISGPNRHDSIRK
jgi:hypothetical protein